MTGPTRRAVLAGGAAVLLAACEGVELLDPPPREVRALLQRWFGEGGLQFMGRVGSVHAQNLRDAGESVQAEVDAVLPREGEDDDQTLARWRADLDADFAAGRVEVLAGFCVGLTEARLCVLTGGG